MSQTLSELQDRLPPFPTEIALQLIEEDLGQPVSAIMSVITPEPVAAASLGQVRAHDPALPCLGSLSVRARSGSLGHQYTPLSGRENVLSELWGGDAPGAQHTLDALVGAGHVRASRPKEPCITSCGRAGLQGAAEEHGRGSRPKGAAARHRRADLHRHGAAAAPHDDCRLHTAQAPPSHSGAACPVPAMSCPEATNDNTLARCECKCHSPSHESSRPCSWDDLTLHSNQKCSGEAFLSLDGEHSMVQQRAYWDSIPLTLCRSSP